MQVRFSLPANSRVALASWAAAAIAGVTAVAFAADPGRSTPTPVASAKTARAARTPSAAPAPKAVPKPGGKVRLAGPWSNTYRLAAGETVEISVRLDQPSELPANGRVAAQWSLEKPTNPADVTTPGPGARAVDAFGLPAPPSAGWRKVLHALDGDVYLIYRAPVAGTYRLSLAPVTEEAPVGAGPRWREKGGAPELFPQPDKTPWPAGTTAVMSVAVNPIDVGTEEQSQKLRTYVETEPNDTPEQAQPVTLVPAELSGKGADPDVSTYEVTGTSDDVEYFDNGKVGHAGDDWYRVQISGNEPKLVSAALAIPGQFLAARIRTYKLKDGASPKIALGGLLPVDEWSGTVNPQRLPYTEGKPVELAEGKDPNERAHQQEEEHRSTISRILEPGKTYYFRVEANAPGYQLTFRVLRPAPFRDPRLAVRQAMYNHIGQVYAWLTNRPRGASVDRRIRDTGNLLGTQCMSCHTHSSVWGPSVPLKNGYRIENIQNEWHLLNTMYECLRPTNELKDAAVNTSLAPLDIGDGPAGTRAAGFNIVNGEENFPAKKLHSKQQIRTANYMLLTSDPGGINAAGPGSNIGQNIVSLFTGEITLRAWKDTGDPKYFRVLEERARRIAAAPARYTDDIGVRMDFFGRVFPLKEYPALAAKVAEAERAAGTEPKGKPEEVAAFVEKVKAQLAEDERRLRSIQNEDGTWHFNPGTSPDGGKTWVRAGNDWDPAPTSLAIIGLTALGYDRNDPSIAKGVQALLRVQDPNGRWNRASITGFVTTAYALRALAPLYPVKPYVPQRAEFTPKAGETNLEAIKRVQALALVAKPEFTDLLLQAAKHPHRIVRYWALLGLGAVHSEQGVPVLVAALDDPAKPIRETATWALKQSLLDDRGWSAALTVAEKGSDTARAQVWQALGLRADAVMPKASVDWARLNRAFDHGMNEDANPAVRAWAGKAAWQWWIWNPPVRTAVNQSWIRMLERAEANSLVENSNRYASQALFIANGHKSNGSTEHQYKELATLFEAIRGRLEKADPATKALLARRLVAISGTFYQMAGGDGGPGQLGYTTPGAGALFGQAATVYLRDVEPSKNIPAIRAGLEGAANIPHRPLQEYLIDYTLKAPEELRQVAASSVSDPRSVMLQAATELVEPLIAQVKRGAMEPARRASLSDPVIKLFGTVNWVIPADKEQQRHFFDLIVPKFDQYYSPQQLAAEADPSKKAAMEREMDAAWYLADKLGEAVANNPDLHHEMMVQRYVPAEFKNPLERHFWVRSVPWILEFKHALPQLDTSPAAAGTGKPAQIQADPVLVIKDRILQVYLDALKPDALPQTRAVAVRISNQTAVRRNPEVLLALTELLKVEKDQQLAKIAENVVKTGSERFIPDLVAALQGEKRAGKWLTADGKVEPMFLQDITYFRDYIIPELARAKRTDQASCMGCHGVPGRVPSFILKPVDQFGYLSAGDLLANYREVQSRVNLKDVENSKLLRKPLNVQDGKEDGHQGGRRYLPQDEGYLILKRWAENQPRLMQTLLGFGTDLRTDRVAAFSLGSNRALKPREIN